MKNLNKKQVLSIMVFILLIILNVNNHSAYAVLDDTVDEVDKVFIEIYHESQNNNERIIKIEDDYDSYSFILKNKDKVTLNNGFLEISDEKLLKKQYHLSNRSINTLNDFIKSINTLVELEAITIHENLQMNTVDEPKVESHDEVMPQAAVFGILSDSRSHAKTLKSVYNNAPFSTKHLVAGKYFATRVKSGGIWDYKVFLGKTTRYYDDVLGATMTGEAMGNFHYGYVGKSVFSATTLKTTAGAYQLYSGTSSWSFWKSYFDDPNDTHEIQKGINRYQAEH